MQYDANGRITRAGAEQAIREGGHVTIGKQTYTKVEALPPETVFAVGDPEATQRALDGLAAQRKALDEQEAKLHEQNAKVEQAKKDAERAQKEREANEKKAQAEKAQKDAEADAQNAPPIYSSGAAPKREPEAKATHGRKSE